LPHKKKAGKLYGMIPMLTLDLHANLICRQLPDGQTKAYQKQYPRKRPWWK
jgi:hypothetical protein